MKLPPVVFVKHCPKLSPERKVFLLKHLEERVPIKDVRWLEDYNHDDTFVWWLNQYLKLPYGLKLTSNFVKTIMALKTMIDENIESAIHMDDDVAFHKDWVSIFQSLPDIDPECFLNLGISTMYNFAPKHATIYQMVNNGGCEALWCSLTFAKHIMRNLNMNHAADIILHGHAYSIGRPLLCVPIVHQTSVLERTTCLDHESRKTDNWVHFVENYATSSKLDFDNILKDFKMFEERKAKLEDTFFELYGKRLEIREYAYITRTGENNIDILQF